MAWYDSGWQYRQAITIAASQVDADLTGFPAMINGAVVDAALFSHAKADGSDIVATASDGTTKLKRELVHYDAGAGELELYVKVPSVSSSTDTTVYLYYGNAAASETNDADTWDASFGLVDHCETDPATDTPVTVDSTANGNDGVIGRGNPANAENDLWGGNAHEFFGADRIEIPDDGSYDPTDAITVEVWVKADSWAGRATNLRKSGSFILYNYSGGYSWYTYGPNHRQQYDVAGELGTGAWGHIVGTYDKDEGTDNKELWLNGAIKISQTVSGALQAGTSDMGIGEEISGTADPFDGLIDEIRISTLKRSDAWITATYRNLSAPATFLTAGSEETEDAGAPTPAPRRPIIMSISA